MSVKGQLKFQKDVRRDRHYMRRNTMKLLISLVHLAHYVWKHEMCSSIHQASELKFSSGGWFFSWEKSKLWSTGGHIHISHINLVHCPCQPQLTHQLGIVDRHLLRNYNAILLITITTSTAYMQYVKIAI